MKIGDKKIILTEETVSMFLGLAIVLVIAYLIFSYWQRRRGNLDVPGISSNNVEEVEANNEEAGEDEMEDGETALAVIGGVHEVVAGENLWKIAEKYYGSGYNWVDIAKANELGHPGLLRIGQKLILPKVESKQVTVAAVAESEKTIEGESYTVVKGDNLWQIAVRAYGDGYRWTDIWQNNKQQLNSPDLLEIGMILNIPRESTLP